MNGNSKRLSRRAYGVLIAVALAVFPVACGGGGGVSVEPVAPPLPSGIVALPSANNFATSHISSPAASSTAITITLPFAPAAGYGGSATLKLPSSPPGLKLETIYSNSAPSLVTPFAAVREAMPTAARVANATAPAATNAKADGNDRVVAYATIKSNQTVTLSAPPRYSFTLPAGFAAPGVAYYLALWSGTTWLDAFSAEASAIAAPAATTVDAKGLYVLTIPANGAVSVALFARNTAAATPAPAQSPTVTPAPTPTPRSTSTPHLTPTPNPQATPTPSPNPQITPTPAPTPQATATPAPTPQATVTPSPTPHATATPTPHPTATPTPTPQPTATPTPLTMTVSSTSLSFTSSVAQHVTVIETGYSGAFTQTNTCSGIATVTPANAGAPTAIFTVTPISGGLCNIHFAGSSGLTAAVSVGVTTISIPVQ